MNATVKLIKITLISVFCHTALQVQPVSAQEVKQQVAKKVAALKDTVARNQAALRQYTWTEHTEISVKGEVKKSKDAICRYGPDGQIAKTPVGTPPPQKEPRGLKKRMVEKKVGELTDYTERAAALVHRYVPPAPDKIQAVFQAGAASVGQAGPGAMQLQLNNYFKQGDSLVLTLDSGAKVLRGISVKSYLDDPSDAVTLDVNFQTLPDGTNYVATSTLNGEAKHVQVKIQNANYQKLAQ